MELKQAFRFDFWFPVQGIFFFLNLGHAETLVKFPRQECSQLILHRILFSPSQEAEEEGIPLGTEWAFVLFFFLTGKSYAGRTWLSVKMFVLIGNQCV